MSSLSRLAERIGLQPVMRTLEGGGDPTGVSIEKPVTQQGSVVCNCRTRTNLKYLRSSCMNQYVRALSDQMSALKEREKYEDDPTDDNMVVLVDGIDITRKNLFVYRTPEATEGAYAVAPHELAFRDPNDTQVSMTPGVRIDPVVFTSFNNKIVDPLNPPSFMGVVDKPEDLRMQRNKLPDTSVVAVAGTRNLVLHNREGITGYAGDKLAYRLPQPPQVDNAGRFVRTKNNKYRGIPADKVVPEVVPMNYAENGNGNCHTQILDHLMNGEEGHKLFEHLAPIADFLTQACSTVDREEQEYYSGLRECLDKWTDQVDVKDDESNHLTERVLTRLAPPGRAVGSNRDLATFLIRITFLVSRSISRQVAMQQCQTIGTLLVNTASGESAEVLVHKTF